MRFLYKFIFLFALIANNSYAGMFDIPLRSLSLNSELKLSNEAFSKMSLPTTFYIQSGKIQIMGVNEKRPYCALTIFEDFNSDEEYVSFKIESIEGAVVVEKEQSNTFRTTLHLRNDLSFARLTCNNPIKYENKLEEVTINDFSKVFQRLIQITNLSIVPGNFEGRFSPKITADFVLQHLKVKADQEVVLKNTDQPNEQKADIGNCSFFKSSPNDEEYKISQNSYLKPQSFELYYYKDSMIQVNPSIILRFDESFGVSCEGSSPNRMFDYQDFWDATGKDILGWTIVD